MEKIISQLPKVSIITTVFNAAATIEQTILSVINQTYSNIEYIIIDGGSNDGTLQIINKYAACIQKIISEPDNGIADGFNKGIRLARGEWIGMINADDWYALDAVETVINNVSPEVDVYCGNLVLVSTNQQRLKKSRIGWLNLGMYIMHPTCFVRAKVYQQAGLYDTSYNIAMDFDMFMRIRMRGFKIKYLNHLIAYMRTMGASSNVDLMHREEFAIMKKYLGALSYCLSFLYKHLNILRCHLFYKDRLRSLKS